MKECFFTSNPLGEIIPPIEAPVGLNTDQDVQVNLATVSSLVVLLLSIPLGLLMDPSAYPVGPHWNNNSTVQQRLQEARKIKNSRDEFGCHRCDRWVLCHKGESGRSDENKKWHHPGSNSKHATDRAEEEKKRT